jgi:hypothetical protein
MSTNGFYRVDFSALLPGAPGIVVLEDSQVRGSDGGYIYSGSFSENGESIEAVLKVKPIEAGASSVFGTAGQTLQLSLSGRFVQGGFTLSGASPVPGGPGINIRGFKVSEVSF